MAVAEIHAVRSTPSAPATAVAGPRQPRRRFRAALDSTPGRLTSTLALLFIVTLAFGVAAVAGALQRQSSTTDVRTSSGPLAVQAEILYRSMSDADATAATAFLASGAEPPALRARYLADIAAAGAALVKASAGDVADASALRQIATGLPTYTGLVETARADNHLGLPVGAAYLREASALMRNTLLRAASSLYDAQTKQLTADRGDAAGFPWLAVPLGLIALAALVRAQASLSRRTRRVLNPGVLSATVAVLIALVWLSASWTTAQAHLGTSNTNGSQQVEAFSQARIDVLRARADESLTLVARGSGGGFETDFAATMKQLTGDHGLLAAADHGDSGQQADARAAINDLKTWQAVHVTIRKDDDGGSYPAAVALATGTGNDAAPAAFERVDGDLGRGIDSANAAFAREAGRAADSESGVAIAVSVLLVLALIALSVGYQRRIAEYR